MVDGGTGSARERGWLRLSPSAHSRACESLRANERGSFGDGKYEDELGSVLKKSAASNA